MDPIEQASEEILRVFMAEHWARFYYAEELDGVVSLNVPSDILEAMGATHPALAAFVTELNGQPLDMESSRRAIGEFVFRSLEGGAYPAGTVAKAFDSPYFAQLMRLFSVWLSGHEEEFDSSVMPFAAWESLFGEWRQDPAVRRFAESLASGGGADIPPGATVH